MVQWKKIENEKSPNPTVQAVKLGPLMRDQGFEPWTP